VLWLCNKEGEPSLFSDESETTPWLDLESTRALNVQFDGTFRMDQTCGTELGVVVVLLLQTKKFNHFDVTCSSPWVTRQARNDQ
jgi:hypothetical protein